MKEIVNFYPVYSKNEFNDLEFLIDYKFSYINKEGDLKIVSTQTLGSTICFNGGTGWNTFDFDLIVNVRVTINNASLLYGKNGIAPQGSALSIYLEWFSQISKFRCLKQANDLLLNATKPQEFDFEFIIPKNTFIYSLNVNVGLYLSRPAFTVMSSETFLNNKRGILLGNLDNKLLCMTGEGSEFPSYYKNDPSDKNLWTIDINYSDPYEDMFFDSIKVTINQGHKDYKYIDPNNPRYFSEYRQIEIIATAVSIIVNDFIQKGFMQDLQEDNIEEGTVAAFVYYQKNNNDVVMSDANTIFESFRKVLHRED